MMKGKRKITYGILTILLIGGLYFGLCLVFDSVDDSNTTATFNSERWLNGNRKVRGEMVDGIINDSLLIGKSKFEILNLLGEPDASDTTNPSFVYTVDNEKKIGPMGLGGTWLFYLTLQFDTLNRKVTEVWCRD